MDSPPSARLDERRRSEFKLGEKDSIFFLIDRIHARQGQGKQPSIRLKKRMSREVEDLESKSTPPHQS